MFRILQCITVATKRKDTKVDTNFPPLLGESCRGTPETIQHSTPLQLLHSDTKGRIAPTERYMY